MRRCVVGCDGRIFDGGDDDEEKGIDEQCHLHTLVGLLKLGLVRKVGHDGGGRCGCRWIG